MPVTHPPRAVSVDPVGTLLFPHPSVGGVCAREAMRLGHLMDAARLESRFSSAVRSTPRLGPARGHWDELMDRTFAGDVPRSAMAGLQTACWEAFARAESWRIARGASIVLAQLRFLGLRVGALSKADDRLRGVLAGKGLSQFLDVVVLADGPGAAKPDPTAFARVARALGCDTGQLLHVGADLECDALAADAAGATGIWLSENPGPAGVTRLARLTGLPELVRSRLVPHPGGRKLNRAKRNLVANLRGQPEERGRSSEREVRTLDHAVEEAVRKLGLDRPIPEHAISAAWGKLLPPALARRTSPLRILADGKLMVQCDGATVRSEVTFLSRALLAKVRALPGCSHVKTIGFVVA